MTISRWTVAAVLFLAWGAASGGAGDWEVARPGYPWSFPRDHWSHEAYRTEWWYFTGHLQSEGSPARRFGYQFTLFRVGLLRQGASGADSAWSARQLLMGHAAISDLDKGRHRFGDILYREIPLLAGFGTFPDPRIAWSRAAPGTAGDWELRWNGGGFGLEMKDDARGMSLRLSTRPAKPLVLQGPGGFSRKGIGSETASLYYSFTRLATEGTLSLDGSTWKVTGVSWMDREFSSSQLGAKQVGWDWFGLQLSDGRDLMLYLLRRKDGAVDFRNATLISPEGQASPLPAEAWSIRPTATWKSAGSGSSYPCRWTLEVPEEGLFLDILPRFPDQENRGSNPPGLHYWEGAVEMRDRDGRSAGEGYVELTGYGEGSRPPV